MQLLDTRSEVQETFTTALTQLRDGQFGSENGLGKFNCVVETIGDATMLKRQFITRDVPIDIPFTCTGIGVHLLFSRNGQSVFNRKSAPFVLRPTSHALNYFNMFECNNILEKNARQDDITFRLPKEFYEDILISCFPDSGNSIPSMILRQKEVNTINEHLPLDAGLSRILNNILDCPYKGTMKAVYIREHLRTLLILQLLQFQNALNKTEMPESERKISSRDEKILFEIKECLDQHFLDPCSLEHISKTFAINEFKIKHGFKVLFDVSPIRYLQQKRLEFALTLIRDTDRSFKSIADEIGYNHASNFTAAFTRTFGKPPQHFRQQVSEEDVTPVQPLN